LGTENSQKSKEQRERKERIKFLERVLKIHTWKSGPMSRKANGVDSYSSGNKS